MTAVMPVGFNPWTPITTPAADAAASTTGAGQTFATMLNQGLDAVAGAQQKADGLAVQAATGKLTDVHDYTIAATQAQLATELTVALRDKAVAAFNEIMRMQV